MGTVNKYFRSNYTPLEDLEAGIVLTGAEVKSIRANAVHLEKAYVKIKDGEAWLLQCDILPYKFAQDTAYTNVKPRKLLLTKKELLKIETKLKGGGAVTVIPQKLFFKHNRVKVLISLARGKTDIDRRKADKEKAKVETARRELNKGEWD